MSEHPRQQWLGYLAALGATAAAALVRWSLDSILKDDLPFVTFFAAIVVAAWYGGLGPAVLSAVLSVATASYLFVPPRHTFVGMTAPHAVGVAAFVVTSLIVAFLAGSLRAAQRRSRLAQVAAARQRELLHITLASIGDAVITTDAQGHVAFLNAVAEELTGWPASDARGRPLTEVFVILEEQTRQPAENPVDRVLKLGRVVGLANHTVLVARDGTERSIDDTAAPIRDEGGSLVGVVLVFHDVSRRGQAEEALARSERDLNDFFETAAVGLHWVGPDGTILRANQADCEMLGYARDEYVGRNVAEFHADQDVIADVLRRLTAGEKLTNFPARLRHKDGSPRHVLIDSSVLFQDGQFVHTRCFTRDVTDSHRAEEALRQADERKTKFLALLAHELRNPMAPLRNGLHVLRLSGGVGSVADEARAKMERQVAHLVRIVDDLLDVSRITHNKLELRREPIALADVLHHAVESSRALIDEQCQELTVTLPPEPVHLFADPTRLAQVFANLLDNSAKYTGPGGRIRLDAIREGGTVVVTVRDTGLGIPKASLPRLFDMFCQVDRTLEKSKGGLGIGLSLVKGLVEMHGGSVEADSEGEGRGSTFAVRLPITEAPAATAAPPAPAPTPCGPARRILVVDDSRDGAESLAMLLRLLGHEVRMAYDGVEAVAAAEAFRPELILMDVGMPKMNGLDATRRIREAPWGEGMVVAALTGWGQEGDRRQTAEAGCDAHLVKPIDLPVLQGLIAGLRG